MPPPLPPSTTAWLAQIPAVGKAMLVLVPMAVGAVTATASIALSYNELATDKELASGIEAHNTQPRAHDASKSVHPDLAACCVKGDALTLDFGEFLDTYREDQIVKFETLTSLQAADWQTDAKKRARAATLARNKFRELVEGTSTKPPMSPAKAHRQVLDSERPPWAR